jgi:hypothetical protein
MSNEAEKNVSSDPVSSQEKDEKQNVIQRSVSWDISPGCRVTFTFENGSWNVTVHMPGQDQQDGTTVRSVTRDQIMDFADKLKSVAFPDPFEFRFWNDDV